MRKEERVSYMMLFCALMMVRNARATVDESTSLVPLYGGAKRLAFEMASQS